MLAPPPPPRGRAAGAGFPGHRERRQPAPASSSSSSSSSPSSSSSSSLRVLSASTSSLDDGYEAGSVPPAPASPAERRSAGDRSRLVDTASRPSTDERGSAGQVGVREQGLAPSRAMQERRRGSWERRGPKKKATVSSLPVTGIRKESNPAVEELEGRKTVEARVERRWARWLCRSALVSNPTPHWCSDLKAPELPLPDDVKSSVLMALILGQLLPPSALPPSLVAMMTSMKEKEKWNTDKVSSAVRRIIDQALAVLQSRDSTRTMPNAALLFNGAPVAVLQMMGICRALAFQRVRGDLDQMLQWYQTCMLVVARRMADGLGITASGEDSKLLSLLSLQGSFQKDRLPAQLWSVFRTGLVFGCGAFLFLESIQKPHATKIQNPASVGIDLSQLFADPRLCAQVRHNLEHVFQSLSAAGLPLIWTPLTFLTYPDDDDTFLLIQAYVLFQTFSRMLPLRRLEQGPFARKINKSAGFPYGRERDSGITAEGLVIE